jgi:hypothetical protein
MTYSVDTATYITLRNQHGTNSFLPSGTQILIAVKTPTTGSCFEPVRNLSIPKIYFNIINPATPSYGSG